MFDIVGVKILEIMGWRVTLSSTTILRTNKEYRGYLAK